MIDSLFIVSESGDAFMEKHWKTILNKSICDYFFEAQKQHANPEDVPPVIPTPHHYLINIYRNKLYFIAVVTHEIAPLFVIEFLHRMMDLFEDYFGSCTETSIKENYVVVYELLDELLDSGLPLATETNILKELIKPPNLLRKVTKFVTRDSTNYDNSLTAKKLSHIPWRPLGITYRINEAFFDVVEEIDAIIDPNGTVVMSEVQGYIDCVIKLSGMPDLTLVFLNPRLLDDVSFHPCVRIKRWESEHLLSFVPPDGHFRLFSYRIIPQQPVAMPIYVRHNIQFREGSSGRFDLSIGRKHPMDKTIENITIECIMPKSVVNCILTPSQGKCSFDSAKKILTWHVGKIESKAKDSASIPNLRGSITLAAGQPLPESKPIITVDFKIVQYAISGLRVQRVELHTETYKPFKGVKYITKVKNGRFQIRT